MPTTRMLVCEVLADDDIRKLVSRMKEHVRDIPEVIGHSILAEEGGRLVVFMTDWSSREACLQHHASRPYREFVASTQHLLLGSYVVKLFQNQTKGENHESRNT